MFICDRWWPLPSINAGCTMKSSEVDPTGKLTMIGPRLSVIQKNLSAYFILVEFENVLSTRYYFAIRLLFPLLSWVFGLRLQADQAMPGCSCCGGHNNPTMSYWEPVYESVTRLLGARIPAEWQAPLALLLRKFPELRLPTIRLSGARGSRRNLISMSSFSTA